MLGMIAENECCLKHHINRKYHGFLIRGVLLKRTMGARLASRTGRNACFAPDFRRIGLQNIAVKNMAGQPMSNVAHIGKPDGKEGGGTESA